MNEVAKLQTNNLAKTLNDHGFYCKIREINSGEKKINKAGMYLIYGLDENTVNSFYGKTDDSLFELATEQSVKHGHIYPKCQVVKINDDKSLTTVANVLENMAFVEFYRDKLKDLGYKNMRSDVDVQTLVEMVHYYNEATNLALPESVRRTAMDTCIMIFEFLDSKYATFDQFFKANPKYLAPQEDPRFEYAHGKKYHSIQPYHKELNELFTSAQQHITSCPIEEKDLPELEKMLNQRRIEYWIDPEFVIAGNYGLPKGPEKALFSKDFRPTVWHKVCYNEAYDALINGWFNARYYDGLAKHAKTLSFKPDSDYIPISIPAFWIEGVVDYLEQINANFVYDIDGTYAPSTVDTIGIVVDNKTDLQRVVGAMNQALNAKMGAHIFDKTLETAALGKGHEREKALKALEQRKNNKLLEDRSR